LSVPAEFLSFVYISVHLIQGWPTFSFHAPIFSTLNSDEPHKHSLPFSPLKRVAIWTYFEVIITYFYLIKLYFILYNKHMNKQALPKLSNNHDDIISSCRGKDLTQHFFILIDRFTSESTNSNL